MGRGSTCRSDTCAMGTTTSHARRCSFLSRTSSLALLSFMIMVFLGHCHVLDPFNQIKYQFAFTVWWRVHLQIRDMRHEPHHITCKEEMQCEFAKAPLLCGGGCACRSETCRTARHGHHHITCKEEMQCAFAKAPLLCGGGCACTSETCAMGTTTSHARRRCSVHSLCGCIYAVSGLHVAVVEGALADQRHAP